MNFISFFSHSGYDSDSSRNYVGEKRFHSILLSSSGLSRFFDNPASPLHDVDENESWLFNDSIYRRIKGTSSSVREHSSWELFHGTRKQFFGRFERLAKMVIRSSSGGFGNLKCRELHEGERERELTQNIRARNLNWKKVADIEALRLLLGRGASSLDGLLCYLRARWETRLHVPNQSN